MSEGAELPERTDLPERTEPPQTGEPSVDEVSRRVADVADHPLDEHHERLSRAHEELHRALHEESAEPTEG